MSYGFDQYFFILVVPAFLFSLFAQFMVKSTFKKYSKISNSRGMTGSQVARMILDKNSLSNININHVSGSLSDNYNPKDKAVNLSDSVYGSNSLAAIGVAAHETGHALQDATSYSPLKLRSSLVPVANIGSSAGPYLAIFGFMSGMDFLVYLGIFLFAGAVAFYLITLPVEFNASRRAITKLEETHLFNDEEIKPIKKVLQAAALTYVASAAVAMANLARLILLARRNNR